ncbi:hypothetical protein ACQ5SO_08675 [Rhodovulum sp. DZ06]|uniref:hypothetical protein n=1 Tax=Rhodovulum sp. DZ06 TaxID=3425126 RepID=UPI003D343C54
MIAATLSPASPAILRPAGGAPPAPAAPYLWDMSAAVAPGGVIASVPNEGSGLDASALTGAVTLTGGMADFPGSGGNGVLGVQRPMGGTFTAYIPLPDATNPGGAPGEFSPSGIAGFTCTGLDRIDGGLYAGAWAVGNHGNAHQDLAGSPVYPEDPHITILSPDFSTVLAEIPAPGWTMQGVAYAASDHSLWVASGGTHLRRYGQDGVEIANYDVSAQGPMNGLVYIDDTDEILAFAGSDNGAHLYDAATGAYKATLDLTDFVGGGVDQAAYDPQRKLLITTTGGNGSPGVVRYCELDLSGGTLAPKADGGRWTWFLAPEVTAVEGIWYDGDATVWICHDGGYHSAATYNENVVAQYSVIPPEPAMNGKLVIGGVTDLSTTTARRLVAGDEGSISTCTWGLYLDREEDFLFIMRSPLNGAVYLNAQWPATLMDGPKSWMLVCDVVAKTLTLEVDGVDQGPPTYAAGYGFPGVELPFVRLGSVFAGGAPSGESWSYLLAGKIGKLAVGDDPAAISAWLAG